MTRQDGGPYAHATKEKAVTELLPCPFCGYANLSDGGIRIRYVVCTCCNATGPQVDAKECGGTEARHLSHRRWNARAAVSVSDEEPASPWQPAFDRMPSDEREKLLHIADQLGKRQYWNAMYHLADLNKLCMGNFRELLASLPAPPAAGGEG